jgi:hypothetical protein
MFMGALAIAHCAISRLLWTPSIIPGSPSQLLATFPPFERRSDWQGSVY